MTALDTNVLVRLLVRDDPEQTAAAERVLERGGRFFVADLVAAEMVWVFRRAYGWDREQVLEALDGLLSVADLVWEDEEAVASATEGYARGGDWSDHLILAKARGRGCTEIYSFDAALRRSDPDFVRGP